MLRCLEITIAVHELDFKTVDTINNLETSHNFGKTPIYTLELSQKSNFEPLTTKPNNRDHPTVETRQI